MVVSIEGVEIELVSLDDVWGVSVNKDVVLVVLDTVKEIERIKLGHGDVVG
ncbi:Uncharacterised protein [Chlamydia trachomatis]|nr:Uncharacterised protein [Chlamydia trachomatis]